MPLVFMVAGVVVVTVVALVAVGRIDATLPEAEPALPPPTLPEDRPVAPADVDAVRFGVGVRGYRMDEVDEVLDRLGAEVAERDARIADLEQRLAARGVPRPDALGFDVPEE